MDATLVWRVLASATADASTAVLCGLLLAASWLRGSSGDTPTFLPPAKLPGLLLPALSLVVALVAQLLLLCASFTGASQLWPLLTAVPDIVATHPGRVSALSIAMAILVLCASVKSHASAARGRACAFFLFACIAFRSASGHASVDGDFTFAELLQVLHLTAMALWSGGVVVSGLFVMPRLTIGEPVQSLRSYLERLSRLSTWAVAVVLVTGALKTYLVVGTRPGLLLTTGWSGWGAVLLVKLAAVAVVVTLGGANRWSLRPSLSWDEGVSRTARLLVRAEAIGMLVVLVLSAWLGNAQPPGE